jgi:hypothetical protein
MPHRRDNPPIKPASRGIGSSPARSSDRGDPPTAVLLGKLLGKSRRKKRAECAIAFAGLIVENDAFSYIGKHLAKIAFDEANILGRRGDLRNLSFSNTNSQGSNLDGKSERHDEKNPQCDDDYLRKLRI